MVGATLVMFMGRRLGGNSRCIVEWCCLVASRAFSCVARRDGRADRDLGGAKMEMQKEDDSKLVA